MSGFLLARRGQRGVLHVCVATQGRLLTACDKRLTPGPQVTVWRSQRLIRALWGEDDAPRCLACSARVSARPIAAGGRRLR